MIKLDFLGMGTVISCNAFGELVAEALEAAKLESERLERMMSRYLPDSEISRINRFAGMARKRVSGEVYEVLAKALEFSKISKGSFDITICPLISEWNDAKENLSPPQDFEIKRASSLVNYNDLMLNWESKSAGLRRSGQSIDLGGIGKGFAADKVLEVFRGFGIKSAFVNFGGNVAVIGSKPDASPWKIGIRHPRKEDELIGMVNVKDESVVTSGDYQRNFISSEGKLYHHIIDSKTGYPAESGVISATVVCKSSIEADGLSTVLFLGGIKRSREVLAAYRGAEAILIDKNLDVHVSPGILKRSEFISGVKVKIL